MWDIQLASAPHASLTADARVVDLQGVDARSLTDDVIGEAPKLIVCDASFIGLDKVLPAALALAAAGADLTRLRQAAVSARSRPGRQGWSGQALKPIASRRCATVGAFLTASGWRVRASAQSPILGGDGNLEYLLWARGPG